MKEWTRFFAAMLAVAAAALAFEQLIHPGNPLGGAVGAAPLLLGLSAGAGAAALFRGKALSAPELAAQRRRILLLVAAGFVGTSAICFGLLLFLWFVAYVTAAAFPWAATALFLGISAAGKCGAIAIGKKGIGLPLARSATAVGAASLALLSLVILGGPLLSVLVAVAAALAWSSASKDVAPPQDPPVDAGAAPR